MYLRFVGGGGNYDPHLCTDFMFHVPFNDFPDPDINNSVDNTILAENGHTKENPSMSQHLLVPKLKINSSCWHLRNLALFFSTEITCYAMTQQVIPAKKK